MNQRLAPVKERVTEHVIEIVTLASGNPKLSPGQRDAVRRICDRIERLGGDRAYTTGTERRVLEAIEKKLALEIKELRDRKAGKANPTKAMCARIRELHGLGESK